MYPPKHQHHCGIADGKEHPELVIPITNINQQNISIIVDSGWEAHPELAIHEIEQNLSAKIKIRKMGKIYREEV